MLSIHTAAAAMTASGVSDRQQAGYFVQGNVSGHGVVHRFCVSLRQSLMTLPEAEDSSDKSTVVRVARMPKWR